VSAADPIGKTGASGQPFKLVFQESSSKVIPNVECFVIFWGGQNVTFHDEIITFYKAVCPSDYVQWLSEYSTVGVNVPAGTPEVDIGRGSWLGSFDFNNGGTAEVHDDDLQKALLKLIAGPSVHDVTDNTLFIIHFAPGIDVVSSDGSRSCDLSGGFCGYHGQVADPKSGKTAYYSVMPDQGGACNGICGPHDSVLKNMYSVATHELGEAITDPLPNGGWFDAINAAEIGDICNDLYTPTGQDDGNIVGADGKIYNVQRLWSNEVGDCIVGKTGGPTTTPVPTTTPIPGSPTPVPKKGTVFPIFATMSQFPQASLPHRIGVLPHTGPTKQVTISCIGKTGAPCTITQEFVQLVGKQSFKFVSSSNTAVSVWSVPANSNVTLTIHPQVTISVYLYLINWPDDTYVFTELANFHQVSASISDLSFSGLLKFAHPLTHIKWHPRHQPQGNIQFTLAYVVKKT